MAKKSKNKPENEARAQLEAAQEREAELRIAAREAEREVAALQQERAETLAHGRSSAATRWDGDAPVEYDPDEERRFAERLQVAAKKAEELKKRATYQGLRVRDLSKEEARDVVRENMDGYRERLQAYTDLLIQLGTAADDLFDFRIGVLDQCAVQGAEADSIVSGKMPIPAVRDLRWSADNSRAAYWLEELKKVGAEVPEERGLAGGVRVR